MIQRAIQRLLDGHNLTRSEAREVMGSIMRGEATPAQIAGFLVALRAKRETANEIAGCAEAMREHVLAVRPVRDDLVDTAGTGGDNAHTLNISTAAALVAAAAGAAVAKHGNRAVSSRSGSADVLEALGFELELPPERIAQSIDDLGFGEDFELLAATPDPLDFPEIGRCEEGEGVTLLRGGEPYELGGYEHFSTQE